MNYKIANVKGTYDSNYPDSKKYVFTLEGVEGDVSAFSKFTMAAGQEITGDIEVKGQYKNFKWGKKTAPPSGDVMIKLDQILREITAIRTELVIKRQLEDKPKIDYPEMEGEPAF